MIIVIIITIVIYYLYIVPKISSLSTKKEWQKKN